VVQTWKKKNREGGKSVNANSDEWNTKHIKVMAHCRAYIYPKVIEQVELYNYWKLVLEKKYYTKHIQSTEYITNINITK